MDDDYKCYFEKGQYYFGYDFYSGINVPEHYLIQYEDFVYAPVGIGMTYGIMYVKRDGKIGVFTMHHCGMGGYGECIFSSNIYPFLYDEVWHNGAVEGPGFGYVAVRINHSWGVLRVEDRMDPQIKKPSVRPCMMIIPCIYPTRQKAISFIDKKLYHPEFKWRKPFTEANDHVLRDISL